MENIETSSNKEKHILDTDSSTNNQKGTLLDYFKETASVISPTSKNGKKTLELQYEYISKNNKETVLSSYLDQTKEIETRKLPPVLIYPFGLNQSQKIAVENAFLSQVSIIQGPPGTGKTQTILNIIANAVRNDKTVAVVSNNNDAIQNVVEKLEKKHFGFITALLGNYENKCKFISDQTGYPDMSSWKMSTSEERYLSETVKKLSDELDEMLNAKNRIAEIEQELRELKPELHYFEEYFSAYQKKQKSNAVPLTINEILDLWIEYEENAKENLKLSFFEKLFIILRYNRSVLKIFTQSPESAIPYLQHKFYILKEDELIKEKGALENKLSNYSFNAKMEELSQKSLRLFCADLSKRYGENKRAKFDERDFWSNAYKLNREYPVILSSTYSIKTTLNPKYIYDYVIVDEASQVNLTTGLLALSCAKNVVIVGDLQQLSIILDDSAIKELDKIWAKYSFDEIYHLSTQSLLSSAIARWLNAPNVLLREHYRCHPKIIGFCNQKFYNGQLIIMTEDHGETDALTLYLLENGTYKNGRKNQGQLDIIKREIIPRLRQKYEDIGIVAPYVDQVKLASVQLGTQNYEINTVHSFQGKEKDAIILTAVDDAIGKFVDNPNSLNVAVSRAINSLSVVMTEDPRNDNTNYGDLVRYIRYNNCEVIKSNMFSVFDMLYKGYAQRRQEYLRKHKRVSEYDSENLLYSVIEDVLRTPEFSYVDCAIHVSLVTLIKNYELLSEDEKKYAQNPLTHTDFLLFNKIDKSPIAAIEVDGKSFHVAGSKQSVRDSKKDSIFEKCKIPLLRIRTDENGERERIENLLKHHLQIT